MMVLSASANEAWTITPPRWDRSRAAAFGAKTSTLASKRSKSASDIFGTAKLSTDDSGRGKVHEEIMSKRLVEVENQAIDSFLDKAKEVDSAIFSILAIGTRAVAYGSLLVDRKWVACSLIQLNLQRLAALSKSARRRFDWLYKVILESLEDIQSRLGPGAEVSDVFGSLQCVDSAICSLKDWQESLHLFAIASFAAPAELKHDVIHVTNTREKVEKLLVDK